jgi:hypothetical protein
MKTNELTGAALDWAVAKCEGFTPLYDSAPHANLRNTLGNIWHVDELKFSTDWAQGGPIIEREMIEIGAHEPKDIEWVARDYWKENTMTGPTPLIAAMRCFVASKMGDDVELPEEMK